MFCDAATFYRDSATNFTVTTQPAAGKPTTQSTKPLPVTITKSSVMQPYFTVTHNQLLNSQFTVYSAIASDHHPKFCDAAIHHSDYTTSCWRAHFTVYSAIASDHHSKFCDAAIFTGTPHPAAVQLTTQSAQSLSMTITPSSLVQPYLQRLSFYNQHATANNPVSSASTGANKPKSQGEE